MRGQEEGREDRHDEGQKGREDQSQHHNTDEENQQNQLDAGTAISYQLPGKFKTSIIQMIT